MDCPSCQWPITLKLQWETHGFACAIFRCESCECDVVAKTPIAKFRQSWNKPEHTEEAKESILEVITKILEESRPSALKAAIEEVLNDD